ncbi:unnamed protein product [Chrysodeixis includens]|uniref:Uncharacterized protein n=1 Tax=Chrysodeixis includens TaxID=689277 RepID=A0A9N8KRQ2_CHRIL|nr:unnamed protein product [Chrysodeixis includens]
MITTFIEKEKVVVWPRNGHEVIKFITFLSIEMEQVNIYRSLHCAHIELVYLAARIITKLFLFLLPCKYFPVKACHFVPELRNNCCIHGIKNGNLKLKTYGSPVCDWTSVIWRSWTCVVASQKRARK